ncbi:TAP-like protein-domain-containing protein [Mycena polygramma]|nr:TAP-like protein-domain-containing protein [Mycena polygramma]
MHSTDKFGGFVKKNPLVLGSPPRRRLIVVVALLLAFLCNWGLISNAIIRAATSQPPVLIRENATIQWTACPDNSTFYCSFFTVPLDYDAPCAEDKTVIAIRMFPATNSERIGSLFTNPGGPGGSGHAGLLKTGPLLSNIFDGKFDIVSWDPRGINMTTPRVSCHPTNLHRELYSLSHDSGDLDFNDADIATLNKSLLTTSSRAQLLTQLCRDAVGDKILRSVTTVNVARDMEQMRKAVGDGGLHYWGFSYGTTLGATYVAMFPEHAERVILDGVVFAPEQYTSLVEHGLSAGKYTSEVFEGFVSNCVSAGPARCALMTTVNTTAAQVSARIWSLASRLETTPLPVPHPADGAVPSILHRGHLLGAIFSAIHCGSKWAEHARNITDAQRAEDAGWGPGREMGASEGGMAVSCGDAPPLEAGVGDQEMWTKEWLGWRDQLAAPNPLGGPDWFDGVVRCRHWGLVKPSPARYEGSWELGKDSRNPKNPVIFVSNSFDPITPISSGRRMVDLFGKENARLLHNNGYGHCSTNHPSVCIGKALKEYLINGTLFEEGTVCEPDEGFMFPPKEVAKPTSSLGYNNRKQDEELAQTLRLLADTGIGMPSNFVW